MRSIWIRRGLTGAAIAVSLTVLLSPFASAAPLYTFYPSYGSYGGAALTGSQAILAHGAGGSNVLSIAPSFMVGTGSGAQSARSICCTQGAGTYSEVVWSGVRGVGFTCSGICGNASQVYIAFDWNVSYRLSIFTSCHSAPGSRFANDYAALRATGEIFDLSAGSASPAAIIVAQGPFLQLAHPGNLSISGISSFSGLHFYMHLSYGHQYALESFVEGQTYAHAAGNCRSYSTETIVAEWLTSITVT